MCVDIYTIMFYGEREKLSLRNQNGGVVLSKSHIMFWDTCFTLAPNAGLLQKNPLLQVQNVSSPTVQPGLLTLLMERATLCTGKWKYVTKQNAASQKSSLPLTGVLLWWICSFDS